MASKAISLARSGCDTLRALLYLAAGHAEEMLEIARARVTRTQVFSCSNVMSIS
jgi:hypothetical protein